MTYVESIKDLERRFQVEAERPIDYQNHFYPCYLEFVDSMDAHFCGRFYFAELTPEETKAQRRAHLKALINNHKEEIAKLEKEIALLEEEIKED